MLQQVELFGRRRDQLVGTADLARRQVHHDVGIAQGAASPWCPAPEQRPHPSEELLVSERLDQVVVGALVESSDAVRRAVLRGEEQDRHIALRAQATRHLEPVHARHHDVQDGEIGHALAGAVEGDLAVRRDLHLVALVNQGAAQRRRDLRVIVDHEDMRLLSHARHHLSTAT